MSTFRKVAADDVHLEPFKGVARWAGSNIAEVVRSGTDTSMACGVHEIFASETVAENPPADEVLYVLEGAIRITVGERTEDLAPGDFAYLPRGPQRTFVVRERVKLIYVAHPANWRERSAD
jgi:ethanolamine utilization protein EutQ (cupin superfamily)